LVATAVVVATSFSVEECLFGLLNPCEPFAGDWRVVSVRVVSLGFLPICPFDFISGCIRANTENLVVRLGHGWAARCGLTDSGTTDEFPSVRHLNPLQCQAVLWSGCVNVLFTPYITLCSVMGLWKR